MSCYEELTRREDGKSENGGKGDEYREKDFTGKETCRKRGIELHFNRRDHRFSTSDLRERVENAPKHRTTVKKFRK